MASQDRLIHYFNMSFKQSEHVTLDKDPWLIVGRKCGSPFMMGVYLLKTDFEYHAWGFREIMRERNSRIPISAYPPTPGMLCPIVVKCTCGETPCTGFKHRKGFNRKMDFPQIPFLHWEEFQEGWDPPNLPDTFALIMPEQKE